MADDITVTSPDSVAVDYAAGMPELPDFLNEHRRSTIAPERLPTSVDELAALALRELDLTRYPMKSWALPKMAPDGSRALDVLVVGAGQAGLAAGFGLLQQRVDNILLIDENAPGREGPWGSYARMETLRTQKDVGGIEAGIPSLSLRAWFEVQYGARAWNELYKVPTEAYHRYLDWYRRVTRVPVRNSCRLVGFGPSSVDGVLRAEIDSADGGKSVLFARTLVLATGIEGNGRRQVPAFISDTVPKQMWAHTHEAIDFDALKGKNVAALGGGASAFDNAILAAEDWRRARRSLSPHAAGAAGECCGLGRVQRLPRPFSRSFAAGALALHATDEDLSRRTAAAHHRARRTGAQSGDTRRCRLARREPGRRPDRACGG